MINISLNKLNDSNDIFLHNDEYKKKEILYTDGNIIYSDCFIDARLLNEKRKINYCTDMYSIEKASYIVKAFYKWDSNYSGFNHEIGYDLKSFEIYIKGDRDLNTLKKIVSVICDANDASCLNEIPLVLNLFKEKTYEFENENNGYLKKVKKN